MNAKSHFVLLTCCLFTLFCAMGTENEEKSSSVELHSKDGAVPVPPGPFDLQTCYELAVLNSETLGLKEADIRIAQARYWQAIGGILPNIHLITEETLENRNTTPRSGSNSNRSTRPDSFSSAINVKQPLFGGFRDGSLASSAANNREAQKYLKTRVLQTLYMDVSDVFYQVLTYEGDLRVMVDIQDALTKRLAEIERRIPLGRSRKGELLMAKSDLADLTATLEQVKGLLGASRELLSFLTGVPAQSLKLADSSPLKEIEKLETYLLQSEQRPDILASEHFERAAEKDLSAAKGEHWPTISAEGNYFLRQSPDEGHKWNVFLTCDLPIFEGGAIEARVSERKAYVRASELNLSQLRRTADKDVRTAYNNFTSSVTQVARLKEARIVSDENYLVQSTDFGRGVVSNLEVLDALRQKQQITQRLHDAEMEAKANFVRLHVTAGALVPDKSELKQ